MTLYAKWLSTDASVESVSVNNVQATAGEEENTFNVSLPYGTEITNDMISIIPADENANVTNLQADENDNSKWTFTVTAEDGATSESYTINVTFTPVDSTLTVEPSSTTLTYGDTLTIKVTPGIAANGINALTAQNTVELRTSAGTVLATATAADQDGAYTLTYDTAGKGLAIGSNPLTVSYGGGGNLNASTATVTVTLNAKPVTASVSGTPSKTFDGETDVDVALTFASSTLVGSDTFTGTVSGNFSDANVGEGKSITLGSSPVWTDPDTAGFYAVTLPGNVTGTISKATPALTLTADPAELSGGGYVTLTLSGLPSGGSATVTCDRSITVRDSGNGTWTAYLPNQTANYTFTASYAGDGNHNSAEATCTVSVTRRSTGGGGSSSSRDEAPSTGDSEGWSGIQDEVADAQPGDTVTIDMGDETEVPAEVFEEVAGKDVTVEIDLGGGVSWSVNGQDVPEGVSLSDLDLSVSMDTKGIPVSVFNAVTGEYSTVQFTLAHDGTFGFTLTLTAPLGRENAGYWANLYYYNERGRELEFVTSARIARDGSAALRLEHASQYAVVIDDKSHEPVDLPFTDVPEGYWAYDAIQYVYGEGLMAGTSADAFSPDATTTRGQIVTILWRLAGNPVVNYLMDYSDVDPTAYYGEAIRWATSEGIVGGYGGGLFGPDDAITREQLAVMLYRYAQHEGYDTTQGGMAIREYADYEQISDFALEALNWAVSAGIINGTSSTTLSPSGSATRAQVAVILMRFCQDIANT